MEQPTDAPGPSKRRARRWPRVVVVALVGLLALPLLVPAALESGAFRDAVSARLSKEGVELGWSRLRFAPLAAELAVDGLHVAVPGVDASVDALRVSWRWDAARQGQAHLTRLGAQGVRVRLTPVEAPAAADGDAAPTWSRLLEPLERLPALRVDALEVRALELSHPSAAAAGLSLDGRLAVGGGQRPELAVALRGGQVEVPLPDAGVARLDLDHRLEVALHDSVVSVRASASLTSATPPPPMPLTELAELDATLAFEPDASRARFELKTLRLVDGAITGSARGALRDGAPLPGLEVAALRADLDALAPALAQLVPGLSVTGGVLTAWTDETPKAALPAVHLGFEAASLEHPAARLGRPRLEAVAQLAPDGVSGPFALSAASITASQGELDVAVGPTRIDGRAALEGRALTASADGPIERLSVRQGREAYTVDRARLGVELQEARVDLAGLLRATASLRVEGVRGPALALSRAEATATMAVTDRRQGRATLQLPFSGLRAGPAVVRAGSLTVDVPSLTLDEAAPARSALDAALGLEVQDAVVTTGARTSSVASLSVNLRAALADAVVKTVTGRLAAAPVMTHDGLGGRLQVAASALGLDGQDLREGGGRLQLTGVLAGLDADLDAELDPSRLRASAKLRAPTLAPFAPIAAAYLPEGVQLELADTGLGLEATVRKEGGALVSELHLALQSVAGALSGRTLAARSIDLRAQHRGAGGADALQATLTVQRPAVAGEALEGPLVVTLDGSLDPSKGAGALTTRLTALAKQELDARLTFTRAASGRVSHRLLLDTGNLGPLLPLVTAWRAKEPEVDFTKLGVHLEARGTTTSFLDERLRPDPEWEAHTDSTQHLSIALTNVGHHTEGERLQVPSATLELDVALHHGAVHVEGQVEVPRAELELGHQHATLTGLHQKVTLDSDVHPTEGLTRVSFQGSLDALEQNVFAAWVPEQVRLDGAARVERLSSVIVDSFLLQSSRAGTRLTLTKRLRARDTVASAAQGGDALLAVGGQRFLLEGRLEQDLARLDGDPGAFRGRGRLAMPFVVDSADHTLFRVRGRLELDDVWASLPGRRTEIEAATGAMTLEEAITFDPEDGLVLVASTDQRVFARARYQDLQPFLASDALVTITRLRVGDVELAPVIASLEVQRNRFTLNKLKARRGPALLSGQLFVDYRPGAETMTFRGAVTGLERQGAAVPLDANAALSFSLSRLEFDGRVQVVRTSKEHVYDLLDVLDPHHELASLNRVRRALDWGYPKRLRLQFHDGLLSMDIELGGLGGLFDLGTVKGISMGPFITRYLVPNLTPGRAP